MIVLEMSRQECLELLTSVRLGRLACTVSGVPYVVPIHFAYQGNYVYSFSMPGRKIDGLRQNPVACLQADEFHDDGWKSVIVNGRYEELPDEVGHKVQRDRAWSLLSRHAHWWEPGALKPVAQAQGTASRHIFYRIEVREVTGRRAVSE